MEQLVEIVAEENAKVGWREYADHIRKGNRDLAAKVSLAIAERAYELGRAEGGKHGWRPDTHGDMVSCDPAPNAARGIPANVGKTYKL